jgi:hypothetical protein
MSAIEKYNNRSTRVFDVDLKGITTWYKARELCGKTIPIIAIGYHKSKNPSYADSVFAITNVNQGVNLPSWHKDAIKAILKDEEAVKEIKDGKVSIKLDERVIRNGTKTVDVTFVTNELPF